ncbi:tetratricopeptide repeat protein [Sorangium sp. So ce861]|uniref:tetratricopeptide repeat protein n=1 Tax=Sorangium sp. So ce861 TaxID=3133323 RepID=UPI003F5D86FA
MVRPSSKRRSPLRTSALFRASLVALMVAALPCGAAHGNDQRSPIDVAREEFRRGTALAQEGRWAAALMAYERSAKLHPHPLATYNMALCERALQRNTRARRRFLQALMEAGPDVNMQDTEAKAWEQIRAIERELGRLHLTVEPMDAVIRIDGRPLELDPPILGGAKPGGASVTTVAGTMPEGPGRPAPAARFDVLLDPGEHVIEVSLPGFISRRRPWHVAEGEEGALSLTLAPAPWSTRELSLFYTGAGLASLGAVGIITGSMFGLRAMDLRNEADKNCRYGCNSEGYRLAKESKAAAEIASATFFSGLFFASAGATSMLVANLAPKRSTVASSGMHVMAGVGRNGSLFTLRGAW